MEVVDGNDIDAIGAVMQEAVEAVRTGGGPYLIEARTHRLSDITIWIRRAIDPLTSLTTRCSTNRSPTLERAALRCRERDQD